MPVDTEAAERAVSDLLRALGHDPATRADLAATPRRVVEAFTDDFLCGYRVDVAELIRSGSSPHLEHAPGVVWVRGVTAATLCPHHLTPAWGHADVAYAPGRRLLDFGVLAGVVDAFARRLTLQETIGEEVTRALCELGEAVGAYCKLVLRHGCLCARGPRQTEAVVETEHARGSLSHLAARAATSGPGA